jgi:hypothetical protein
LGKVVGNPTKLLTLEEVKAAIAFHQPKLRASTDGQKIHIEGVYLVFEEDVVAVPDGPLAEFDIRMELPDLYPCREPKVFEVGGRIPREPKRHINPDGDCCVTVWEHWLATANDHSFGSFLRGPLNEYFLGQFWFEQTGKWPFGERPHGMPGLEEAYADALQIANKRKSTAPLPSRRLDGYAASSSAEYRSKHVAPAESEKAGSEEWWNLESMRSALSAEIRFGACLCRPDVWSGAAWTGVEGPQRGRICPCERRRSHEPPQYVRRRSTRSPSSTGAPLSFSASKMTALIVTPRR